MFKRDDCITLSEIGENIRLARSFMAGQNLESFSADSNDVCGRSGFGNCFGSCPQIDG